MTLFIKEETPPKRQTIPNNTFPVRRFIRYAQECPLRGRSVSTTNIPGYGLGHSIVGGIVEKYDGLLQLNHQDEMFTAQALLPITGS